eukprot:CAMPEP_0196192950 /NCGR_PEP_ID=MMETSP0911-20130528/49290_1 /TAXON_ID=49265 /ORGANISM="Thalassiosira rotula, Strain GSO102" /LENGTH=81 /DNA_ID=CAMNT_0041465167 /DNA_START=1184 /DNA_END=1426 /DNA_ORIENTATION=+
MPYTDAFLGLDGFVGTSCMATSLGSSSFCPVLKTYSFVLGMVSTSFVAAFLAFSLSPLPSADAFLGSNVGTSCMTAYIAAP